MQAASKPMTLELVSTLTRDDETRQSSILNILKNKKPDSAVYKEMLLALKDYPLKLLFRLAVNSPEIRRLLQTDETLNAAWCKKLKENKIPAETIISFDGTRTIYPFDQLMASYLLATQEKYSDQHAFAQELLDKACELGSYDALIQRLDDSTVRIADAEANSLTKEQIQFHIARITADAAVISNLYWSLGCIDAAIKLLDVAKYYFFLTPQNIVVERFFMPMASGKFAWPRDDKSWPAPILIAEIAVETLFRAKLLADFPPSKQVTEMLTNGCNLLTGYENYFQSEEKLQHLIAETLKNLKINSTLIPSFYEIAHNRAVEYIKKHIPDFNHPAADFNHNHLRK